LNSKPAWPVADTAPDDAQLTDYDRAHVAQYLRLLDAEDAGAPWTEVTILVLGIDPAREPERARRAYESHLARARWMIDPGYRDLLGKS
jgi:hypothetical protein